MRSNPDSLAPKAAHTGWFWWLGAAGLLYLGIGAAIAAGALEGGAWIYVEWEYVVDLFGLRAPRQTRAIQLWWVIGMPWSLLAGSAVWGLAGLCGAFEPGSLRPARFAGVVFGGALLAWTASVLIDMATVRAAEERASGIHGR